MPGSIVPKRPSLLSLCVVLLSVAGAIVIATAGTPGTAGDTTADFELGQEDFTHQAPQFLDARSLSFASGAFIAIDKSSTPNHLYVADPWNNRILAWNDAAMFTSGQAADLVIGQMDQW